MYGASVPVSIIKLSQFARFLDKVTTVGIIYRQITT